MKRFLLTILLVLVLLWAGLSFATWRLSRPLFDERLDGDPFQGLSIAPLEAALTLARTDSARGSRVVLVTHAEGSMLKGIDLERVLGRPFRDAVEAFTLFGFEKLQGLTRETARIEISVEQLGLPLDPAYPHIAAGTNYQEHAEEVGHEEGPFLFPKLSRATAWNADVADRGRLDYEAEICAVTLDEHTARKPAPLGYVLCNDFTDRWTLVRQIDLGGPMGLTGFADGKGGEGMLPVGPLLVIPKAAETLYRDWTLELFLEGRLRQRARGGQMIWSPSDILSRALKDCDLAYQRREGTIGLTDCAGIPARTLVLTGTPGGVLFHPLTLWARRAYLEPGDVVVTRATHLGVMRNRIR